MPLLIEAKFGIFLPFVVECMYVSYRSLDSSAYRVAKNKLFKV